MERHFCRVGVVVIHEDAEDLSAPGRGGDTKRVTQFLPFVIEGWGIDRKILLQPGNVVEIDDSLKKSSVLCLVESSAIYIVEGGFWCLRRLFLP